MVSVDGVTYRIERITSNHYAVVRLQDDAHVGTFKTGAELEVFPDGIDALLLEVVARDAVMKAKTSWIMHAPPSPPPAPEPKADEGIEPPVSSSRRLAPA
jgi:hypothetical protein